MSNAPEKVSEGYYTPWGCHQKILSLNRFVKFGELFDLLHEARRTSLNDKLKVTKANPVYRLKMMDKIYPVAKTTRFPEDIVLVNISNGVVADILDEMIGGYDSAEKFDYSETVCEILKHLNSKDQKVLADAGVWDRESFESYEGLTWNKIRRIRG